MGRFDAPKITDKQPLIDNHPEEDEPIMEPTTELDEVANYLTRGLDPKLVQEIIDDFVNQGERIGEPLQIVDEDNPGHTSYLAQKALDFYRPEFGHGTHGGWNDTTK